MHIKIINGDKYVIVFSIDCVWLCSGKVQLAKFTTIRGTLQLKQKYATSIIIVEANKVIQIFLNLVY